MVLGLIQELPQNTSPPWGDMKLIELMGRPRFERGTIGLKVQKGDLTAFLFNDLPWRLLQPVHHNA